MEEEIREALKENALFKNLPRDMIDYLVPYITLRYFKKGRIIFFEGDVGKIVYMVKSGLLEVYKRNREGDEHILAELKPGDFVGEMAIIQEIPRTAGCRARKDSEVLLFTKRAFDDLLSKEPKTASLILLQVAKVLSKRLQDTTKRLDEG